MTTVGYGDYTPRGDTALGFTTLYALFGTVLVSVENKPRMAGRPVSAAQAADWPMLAGARGSLEHGVALKEAPGEPAGRGLSETCAP